MNERNYNSANHSDTSTVPNNSGDHPVELKPSVGGGAGSGFDHEWGFSIGDIHEKTDARRHFSKVDWSKTTVTNKDKPTHVNYNHEINLMDEEEGNHNLPGDLPHDTALDAMSSQQMLDLIQITNANFPIGSFSHSFGIETYIRKELVHNGKTLKSAIKSYIFGQFLYLDLLGIIGVYKALANHDLEQVWNIDRLAHASGMSKETVEGARRIGTQMVKIYHELFPDCEDLVAYQDRIDRDECTGVPGVAFGIMAHYLKVDLKTALYIHLSSATSAQIQNAVRAIPLGQIEGQKVMLHVKRDYFDRVIEIALAANFEEEFCRNAPGFEIAQMEHEETNVRLFMS